MNVIQYPKFYLSKGDVTLDRLETAIESLGKASGCLQQASLLLSPAELIELDTTFNRARVEIEKMKNEGNFTRERLNVLVLQLQKCWLLCSQTQRQN